MRQTNHRLRYTEDGVCISLFSMRDDVIGFCVVRDKTPHKQPFVPMRDLTAPVNAGLFATIQHNANKLQSQRDRKAAWDNDGRAKYEAPVMTDHKMAIDQGAIAREATKFDVELPVMSLLKRMGVWSKPVKKPIVGGGW